MFSNQLCPKNKQLMALTRLEGTSWYQAKDPVDDYIDHFQELTDLVEYDDDKTIVIKFQHGLDPALQNQVALLRDGAPNFDDPKGWYEAAHKVSQNREANEAFVEMNQNVMHNSICSTPPLPKSKVTFTLMRKMFPSLAPPADEHGCRSQHVSNSNSASVKHLSLLPSPTASSQPTLPRSIHHLSSIIHHQWQLPISSLLNYRLDFPDIQ